MKISFNPLFYLFCLICIFNGLFKDLIYIMFIILFHELGHIICGLYFKWKIEKVIILPLGSITIFNNYINVKLKEEFLVTLFGPLFQSILFIINNDKFRFYNLILLIFNLLPIVPLDGSKILNIILNKFIPFKKSYKITNIISVILCLILIYYYNELFELLIIILLIKKILESILKGKYIFNKFLLERYLYKFKFNKRKTINCISKMKKDTKHLFYIDKTYISEDKMLSKMFDKTT